MLPDGQIARVLNRLGLKTGRNNNWTAGRVNSLRHYHGIPVYDPEICKQKGLLTLQEAAASLDVSASVVARLLHRGILPGRQVVPYAPWTIRAADLQEPAVQEYVRRNCSVRPWRGVLSGGSREGGAQRLRVRLQRLASGRSQISLVGLPYCLAVS